MKIVRSDGKVFVFSLGRENLPLVMPRKQKIERLNSYQATFGGEFACAYKEHGRTVVVFAPSAGYSIAECARDKIGEEGKVIWTEPTPDEEGYILVTFVDGSVLSESILGKDDDLDDLMLLQLFGGEGQGPKIVSYGGLPPQLQLYLLETEHETEHEELEEPLLEQLKTLKNYQLRRYQDVLAEETAAKALSLQAKIVAVGALVAVAAIATLFLRGEESVVRVFDRYADYRNVYSQVTATPMLAEIYGIMRRSHKTPRWQFSRCEFNGAPQLVCELVPLPGARASELQSIGQILQRPTQINLVEDVAHVIITLDPEHPRREGNRVAIVHRPSVMTALRDRITQIAAPETLTILAPVNHETWSQQSISIARSETGLHFLGMMAKTTINLPVILQEMMITREGGEYSISATLQTYGAN